MSSTALKKAKRYEPKLDTSLTRCKGQLLNSEVGMCPLRTNCQRHEAYVWDYLTTHQVSGDDLIPNSNLKESFIRKEDKTCKMHID
jgi:hypothetical protein